MVLIIILTELVSYIDKEVSVPLRGLWFLSRENNDPRKKYMTVSVPLRGLWFLSSDDDAIFNEDYEEVSVPLRGLWFLSLYFLYLIVKVQIRGFRPLTGIMVLICIAMVRT